MLFDKPVYKDWIFYLALLAVFAGLKSSLGNGSYGTAEIVDVVFAIAFQYALFGLLPCWIRLRIRAGRTKP